MTPSKRGKTKNLIFYSLIVSFSFHVISDIDECVSQSQCQNGGNCIDGVNQFTCQCVPGFTGNNCEISKFKTHNHSNYSKCWGFPVVGAGGGVGLHGTPWENHFSRGNFVLNITLYVYMLNNNMRVKKKSFKFGDKISDCYLPLFRFWRKKNLSRGNFLMNFGSL